MKKYDLNEVILYNETGAGQNEQTETGIEVSFQGWEQFGKSFEYMGAGMLGIFIVMAIIIGSISLLNKIKK